MPSTGDTVYTSLQVLGEMDHYSSWDVVVPVNTQATVAYYAALWTQYRQNTEDQLLRAVDAVTADYDPLSNYDMKESGADGKRLSKETDTTTPTGGTKTTTYKYGINSGADGAEDGRAETVPIDGAKTELTREYQNNQSMTYDGSTLTGYHDANEHYMQRHGNIGVTTNVQLISGEVEMRLKTDLLRDYIKEFFARYGFCVGGDC